MTAPSRRNVFVFAGVVLLYVAASVLALLRADPKSVVAYALVPIGLLTEHGIPPLPFAYECAKKRIQHSDRAFRSKLLDDPLMTYNFVFSLSERSDPRSAPELKRIREISDLLLGIGLPVDKIGPAGCTSLQLAARTGDDQLMSYLVSKGADMQRPGDPRYSSPICRRPAAELLAAKNEGEASGR